MRMLEDYLKPPQRELFNLLSEKYRNKALINEGGYILIQGKAPIMLLAHLDTVHQKPVKQICKSPDGNILMSPQGIGGDDRCGVYALVKAHEASPIKPWLLFTCDEEIGGVGADIFAEEHNKGRLPKDLDTLKLLIEIDRKGSRDAVYYDCDNQEFEKYITSKGFVTAFGSFSDISIVAPELGVAAVNLSSGYYNAHTLHEYINRKQLEAVIQKVIGIIADAVKPDFPKYKYIKCAQKFIQTSSAWNKIYSTWKFSDNTTVSAPKDLPADLVGMYLDLLDIYPKSVLDEYRKEYGDWVITHIYEDEFGSLYGIDDVSEDEWHGLRKENETL